MELFWHNAPLVRILVPLLLGLISALRFDSFSDSKPFWIVAALVTIVLLASLDKMWKQMSKNHYFGILSSITFFLLGAAMGYNAIDADSELPAGDSYLAIVETLPVEKANSYAVNLKVFNVQTDSFRYQSCDERIIAYFSKEGFDSRIIPGNSIRFSGAISDPGRVLYPNQFDYGKYLRNTGISGTVYIPAWSYEFIEVDEFSLRGLLNRLRGNLLKKLNEDSIPLREYGVISALLVGDRSFLDPQLRNDFADAGAVHILAVSGLHVGIIYLLFLSLLNLFFKNRAKLLKFLLVLLILWGYAALTGFSPSVLRAAAMFSFIALGKYHKRYGNIYNMIAASALILIALNPLLITQIGFQLSYLAVIGIVFFFPKFHSLWTIENKYLDKLWSLFCVSIAAQLATFPLSIYYFHQFPSLFMVTNILVIPLASFILYFGVAWIIFLWLPYVCDVFAWITIILTRILNTVVERINAIPYAKIEDLYLSSVSVLLIYLLIVLVTVFLSKPSRVVLRCLGLATVFLFGLFIHRRYNMIFQDELLFPTLSEDPTIIRLVKDEMYIFSQDSAAFIESWERELYPYFLPRGFRKLEDFQFVGLDDKNEFLVVQKSLMPSEKSDILWNRQNKEVRTHSEKEGHFIVSESSSPLLRFKVEHLTHFSSD